MIRSRAVVTVFGNTHAEILDRVNSLLREYLDLAEAGLQVSEYADIEIEVSNTELKEGFSYRAIAYCKIK